MISSIFTIGYSPHERETFVSLLKASTITAVVDVRSQPYSRYKPDFNREALESFLKTQGIAYVFLGREIGARCPDPACYRNGQVQFDLVAKTDLFRQGIDRLRKGMERHIIALMCAEKDPITCHRTILISKALQEEGIEVRHILADGTIETNREAEKRLAADLGLTPTLFEGEAECIESAYKKQAELIAYVESE